MKPCLWIERDYLGRPRCEHGWAVSQGGGKWDCPTKKRERDRRYRSTAKAIRVRIRENERRGLQTMYLKDALGERERYEASGSSLSFIDWLYENEPLQKLKPLR